jgi:hypothetical protein
MSDIQRREPTPDRFSAAVTESESNVVSSSGLNPHSLVEDHRERWRHGERMPVEAYLERFRPAGVDAVDLLDLIYNEVVLREEDGESPQLDEYVKRFPLHDDALRDQFEVHQFLRASGSFAITLSPTSIDSSDSPATEFATVPVRATTKPDVSSRSTSDAGLGSDAPRIIAEATAHASDPSWPHVDGFDIVGVLGSGGMGTVYRAFDRRSGHPVALKTINHVGATTLLRFKQEFRTLLDVAHPNLVTLY